MDVILATRPTDPIAVLARFLEQHHAPLQPLDNALQLIRKLFDSPQNLIQSGMFPCSDPEFPPRVLEAFECLCREDPNGVVRGGVLSRVLSALVSELPPQAADTLLRHFRFEDDAIVPWGAFHAAVHTCLLYARFLAACETLFSQAAAGGAPSCSPSILLFLLSIFPHTSQPESSNQCQAPPSRPRRERPCCSQSPREFHCTSLSIVFLFVLSLEDTSLTPVTSTPLAFCPRSLLPPLSPGTTESTSRLSCGRRHYLFFELSHRDHMLHRDHVLHFDLSRPSVVHSELQLRCSIVVFVIYE